jgi:hypothetical protein
VERLESRGRVDVVQDQGRIGKVVDRVDEAKGTWLGERARF